MVVTENPVSILVLLAPLENINILNADFPSYGCRDLMRYDLTCAIGTRDPYTNDALTILVRHEDRVSLALVQPVLG